MAYYIILQAQRSRKVRKVYLFHKKKYTEDLINEFNMMQCKYAVTPKNINEKLKLNADPEVIDTRRYKILVGGLIYLMNTWLDIVYSVGFVSRFINEPARHHFGTARRILKYTTRTLDY